MLTADPWDRARELLEAGEPCCLGTVVAAPDGAVPVGHKVLVRRDGTVEGSLGSGAADQALVRLAREALARTRKGIVEPVPGLTVFLDVLAGEAELLICGAGHIAVPLAEFARRVGFAVTVLDDRPDFAHPSRFPGCTVLAEEFTAALGRLPLGPTTYAVVITRGHEHDAECLAAILAKPTAYVGLIGSRRRVRFVLAMLEEEGLPAAGLAQVFTPIGVPLGAESPEEIALSIAAELVCVRRQGPAPAQALRAAAGGER